MTRTTQFPRPSCLCKDRLLLWRPIQYVSNSLPTLLQHNKQNVILNSIQESTRITYGTGLSNYHIFCDKLNIPASDRAPASTELISAFIASVSND